MSLQDILIDMKETAFPQQLNQRLSIKQTNKHYTLQKMYKQCVDAQADLHLCCSYATKSGFLASRHRMVSLIRQY